MDTKKELDTFKGQPIDIDADGDAWLQLDRLQTIHPDWDVKVWAKNILAAFEKLMVETSAVYWSKENWLHEFQCSLKEYRVRLLPDGSGWKLPVMRPVVPWEKMPAWAESVGLSPKGYWRWDSKYSVLHGRIPEDCSLIWYGDPADWRETLTQRPSAEAREGRK